METKKAVLIILTILIVGPIVFIGGCLPVGVFAFSSCFESSCPFWIFYLFYLAWPLGIFLAIFVCYKIIKKIVSPKEDASQSN